MGAKGITKKDLSFYFGQRFGSVVVVGKDDTPVNDRNGRPVYYRLICHCDCGSDKSVYLWNLLSGRQLSCGGKCPLRRSSKFIDQTGRKVGLLTVAEYQGKSLWRCVCDCGHTRIVYSGKLLKGDVKSCGCLGNPSRDKKHGLCGTSIYNTWHSMIGRCYLPTTQAYERYGGRGIQVCDSWRSSFSNFIRDVGLKPSPKHTLDRIDSKGNYEPGNVRWATTAEQARNKSSNRYLTVGDRTMIVTDWGREYGVRGETILYRLKKFNPPYEFYMLDSTRSKTVTS